MNIHVDYINYIGVFLHTNMGLECDSLHSPTSMNVGVLLHVRLLVKTFATVATWIGSGVTVYEQMGGEGRRSLERLTTLNTCKTSLDLFNASKAMKEH